MFTEIVSSHDGNDSHGTATESHALTLLRRAYNRGYAIEATGQGGVVITWRRIALATHRPVLRSITLTPKLGPLTLTEQDLDHFRAIDSAKIVSLGRRDGARIITAGLYEIAPEHTDRLVDHGLVAADRNGSLRLTLTARLAALAKKHVSACAPQGRAVTCLCGFTVHARSAEEATQRQQAHQARVSAEFVDSLSATFTAAVAAAC
ncbi:hypothetical protein ACFVHS_25315 [Streptomyces sp. NPDC057746]|uniref:hypothetical protein n=1 Tax=Streptomyces sp. NPDC057746 TaxID=3346237 RepID=UPI003678C189